MSKLRCAVVGVGYLGQFHVEKYALLPEAELVAVCDIDQKRCTEIANAVKVKAVVNYQELLGQVDAVSIASDTTTHYQIAKDFIQHGTHVLVEKPITTSVAEAEELIALAKQNNVVLQVGHLERFNPALLALKKVLSKPIYIESLRLAPFKPRATDVNVILDLMIHDIDIIQHLVATPIVEIRANGAPVLSESTDLANARIEFANGCIASATASRVNFTAKRKLRIFQHDAYFSVDLQNKKLSIHRKGPNEMFPGIPEVVSECETFCPGDALRDEIINFLGAIAGKNPPAVTGEDGKFALETAIKITNAAAEHLQHVMQAQQID